MTIIEDLYSNLDSKFSKIYNEILLANYDNPTLREMRIIKNKCLLFINFIRWRMPARDKIVLNKLNKYNFEDLYYYICNAKTGLPVEDETIISAFKSLNFLNKSQAALIITVPFDNIEHVEGVSNSTELHSQSAYPSLICDNPYIEKNPTEDIKIFNEFIFPLTKYDFVIYSKTFTGSTLNQDFALAMELAKLENAEKYVACADRDHLIKLTNAYREMRKKNLNEFIIPNLFKFLD